MTQWTGTVAAALGSWAKSCHHRSISGFTGDFRDFLLISTAAVLEQPNTPSAWNEKNRSKPICITLAAEWVDLLTSVCVSCVRETRISTPNRCNYFFYMRALIFVLAQRYFYYSVCVIHGVEWAQKAKLYVLLWFCVWEGSSWVNTHNVTLLFCFKVSRRVWKMFCTQRICSASNVAMSRESSQVTGANVILHLIQEQRSN